MQQIKVASHRNPSSCWNCLLSITWAGGRPAGQSRPTEQVTHKDFEKDHHIHDRYLELYRNALNTSGEDLKKSTTGYTSDSLNLNIGLLTLGRSWWSTRSLLPHLELALGHLGAISAPLRGRPTFFYLVVCLGHHLPKKHQMFPKTSKLFLIRWLAKDASIMSRVSKGDGFRFESIGKNIDQMNLIVYRIVFYHVYRYYKKYYKYWTFTVCCECLFVYNSRLIVY